MSAAWRPSFTEFLHEYLLKNPTLAASEKELYIGDVIAEALSVLNVQAEVFDDGEFVDIGTPDDLALVTQLS